MENNPTITLRFTVDKVNLILNALGELPYRASADLIADLREQAASQLQPTVPEPKVVPGKGKE